MPQIYIPIPEDIQFFNPKTKEPIKGDGLTHLSFKDLMDRVMENPKWNQSYKLIKTADAIMDALEDALKLPKGRQVMVLADGDYKELKDAIENPRIFHIMPGLPPQTQSGFGIHPSMSRQLIPLLKPIMDADETDPRKEWEKDGDGTGDEVAA